ncbi:MAG: MBL fold metallo-hydrolase [candidate division WOR-3 bacterium]|nr:MBL fold metallo-hydrolase [candidate division WOR-3 bacterium]MDW8151163.1 MBL fold metallo-hydrolase [candidate division WOR-3 bacterium]
MRHIKLGSFDIYQLNGGKFALDGGAMFGVVPKAIWEKLISPDEKNRIPMAVHPLLVKTQKAVYLIDIGIGKNWDSKFKEIYDVYEEDLFSNLDVGPEDVDYIIATHLHFDHMAGYINYNFKKAKVIVQKMEWQDANFPHLRSRASYIKERIEPLSERIILIEGDYKLDDGIYLILTGGHTRGHQIVLIERFDKGIIFMADLVPTVHHINYPYIMGYDLYPVDTLYARYRIYSMISKYNYLMAFEHDREAKVGYLKFENDKPKLELI